MLVDHVGERIVSSQGWHDRGSLWVFDTRTAKPQSVPLGDYDHLVLVGTDGYAFIVVGEHRGGGFTASVRRFAEPAEAVAEAELRPDGGVELRGEASAWRGLPRVFAGHIPQNRHAPYAMLLVEDDGSPVRQSLWSGSTPTRTTWRTSACSRPPSSPGRHVCLSQSSEARSRSSSTALPALSWARLASPDGAAIRRWRYGVVTSGPTTTTRCFVCAQIPGP